MAMKVLRHPERSAEGAQSRDLASAGTLRMVERRPLHFASLRSGRRITVAVGLVLAATSALAANGIDVTRGQDAMVFGNCVPSLVVENKSAVTIDYLQVDVVVALENGQERTVELKSAYREGVLYPIGPGGKATLKQHLDTSKALGVGCGDLKARRVLRTICEAEGGKSCASSVSVQP
jgi:hypothetical protein